jgi:ribosome biogenesis GTPase
VKLEDFGYYQKLEEFRIENNLINFEIGRVIAEHKERYIVKTITGDYEAEITGKLRFNAKSRIDFPAVGDWVALSIYESDFSIIHVVLPRFSVIQRQAVGKFGEIQIIAANIDCAFLVQAVDRDFNFNRLERYLTICNASKVKPIIVLSKIDLLDERQITEIQVSIELRIKNTPVISISNKTRAGYDKIIAAIEKGKTYCLLGSSGVGKSTLLNTLTGKILMRTDEISKSSNKGRHITSHRELFILENGGILVDNPGMREVGLADSTSGLEITFGMIVGLSQQCKFQDCTHTHETGCAVIDAVSKGEIDGASYENYLKMEREKAHFESTVRERRKKEKLFGKIIKNYKKDMNKNS